MYFLVYSDEVGECPVARHFNRGIDGHKAVLSCVAYSQHTINISNITSPLTLKHTLPSR